MNHFVNVNHYHSEFVDWFQEGITQEFIHNNYELLQEPQDDVKVVFNYVDPKQPRPYRRKAQATFVISVIEGQDTGDHPIKQAYPYLVRTLSNHLVYICHGQQGTSIHFVTPEQGFYQIQYHPGEEQDFFRKVFKRLEPLATSQLIINNHFEPDLPEELWNGDEVTNQLHTSGKKLDDLNLLPAPFPLEEFLDNRDMRHLKKLYGIGGLSYGNLSGRKDENHFWMSASGVDKSNLNTIGEDILLIKQFNEQRNAMDISVPPEVTPKRASVDAIEHWMIYSEHPEVGAIVHIHAWMDGVEATPVNYPCGTVELAETVAELVRQAEDPSRAVIGLKNHGLTITGRDLDDIFERIDGKIIPQVPMN